jgi:hypothetical protein
VPDRHAAFLEAADATITHGVEDEGETLRAAATRAIWVPRRFAMRR